MILRRKHAVAFGRPVVVTLFEFWNVFHAIIQLFLQKYGKAAEVKPLEIRQNEDRLSLLKIPNMEIYNYLYS